MLNKLTFITYRWYKRLFMHGFQFGKVFILTRATSPRRKVSPTPAETEESR